ncbi:MAG: HAMP domain-containing histidine kinase [Lachnospiraceae bacterium]|jgi:signal transduction histidine kinase|nr:HAMP domain-containing histidine kinase [Lachnospiraceae bacterium]
MKLKTRTILTFFIIVLVPFFLIIAAFWLLGSISLKPVFILAILVILFWTAVFISTWNYRSVYHPINELNRAMQNIAEGNLDYQLPMLKIEKDDEISELISNYEEMRLRLKESAEEKIDHEYRSKELITNITHDLKTPMTAIKGYVEGLMDGVADTPEKMDKYVKTIYNKTNDMDKLINELTIYSGIDNNRVPYNFQKVDIGKYMEDCVEEFHIELDNTGITLTYENELAPGTVILADTEQLKRVVTNIVDNSQKYIERENGKIEIRLIDEKDSVRIEIEDNGKGISSGELMKIFDRFYRTDASRNSGMGGSGIGLSIVKKIIEDHGGYIWATSVEGEGTCIHFVLQKYIAK